MNSQSIKDNLRKIGKLSHAHGLRGELYLNIYSGDYNWFKDVDEIYLESKTQFKNYKVKSTRPHKEGVLVTLFDVDNRNQSDVLSGSEVWVNSDIFITEHDDNQIFLVEIEGFEVYDGEKKIGKIIGFTYNGAQDLLIVSTESLKDSLEEIERKKELVVEYEIPFVEQFIEDIDYDTKKIIMNLPEGLLEVQIPVPKQSSKIVKEPK
jgi:16S rRNA processing protein RimM